jgi:hypothetical protein
MPATNPQKRPEIDEGLTRHMDETLKLLEQEARKGDDANYYSAVETIKDLLVTLAFSHQLTPSQNAQLQRILATWGQFKP